MKYVTLFLSICFLFTGTLSAQPGTVVKQFNSPTSQLADLTWDGSYLYLLGLTDHIIYQIDPANGQVLGSTATGISGALGLTWFDGHFWVSVISDHTVKKLNVNGSILKSVPVPAGQNIGMEWDGSALWIADSKSPDEKILQVDTLGTLLHSFLFPGDSPFGLTWDGSTVWCANNQMSGGATIYQFDPATGAVLTSFPCPNGGSAANGLTWDGQYLWIADNTNDKIYQVVGNPLPQFGAIEGRVTDALTGWGIGYIPLMNTRSDTGGYFFIDSLPAGSYSLTFAAPGFVTRVVDSIAVIAGDTTAVTVSLNPLGDPLRIRLKESDGDEWFLQTYRDSLWRYYRMPLGLFRGSGGVFLDSPVTGFVIEPLGGGSAAPPQLTTEVVDWIDRVSLADSLVDDFDDGDYSDWNLIVATNGSYLNLQPNAQTPDSSAFCLEMVHGNTMSQPFAGWMEKICAGLIVSPSDTLCFWLRGVKYPLSVTADNPQPHRSSFRLQQNYPNPFNSSTQITFELSSAGEVSLQVYNLIGQKVRTLVNGRKLVGTHRVKWNGRDDLGQPVASGVYIYRLSAGEHFVQSRKMLLLR